MTTDEVIIADSSSKDDHAQKARKRHVTHTHTHSHTSNSNNSNKEDLHQHDHQQSRSARLRHSIVQHTRREEREHRRIERISMQSHDSMQRFYKALILNAILVFMGGVLYFKPEVFFHHMRTAAQYHPSNSNSNSSVVVHWPPHQLAVLYPLDVTPHNDLPLFFQHYSIATADNQASRDAVRRLLHIRQRLKPYQVLVTAWERELLWKYPMDQYCGKGLRRAYDNAVNKTNFRHAEDLLHFCLLYTYQNDGFLHYNTTLKRVPFAVSPDMVTTDGNTLKGIVPKHVLHNRIHPSFLWLPKKREEQIIDTPPNNNNNNNIHSKNTKTVFDMNSHVPAKMLPWLIHTAPSLLVWEYPHAMEEYLYQLIHAEQDRWILLDTICDHYADDDNDALTKKRLSAHYQDRRIMARDCSLQNDATSCCTVYMPQRDDDRLLQQRQRRLGRSNATRGKQFQSSSSSDSRD